MLLRVLHGFTGELRESRNSCVDHGVRASPVGVFSVDVCDELVSARSELRDDEAEVGWQHREAVRATIQQASDGSPVSKRAKLGLTHLRRMEGGSGAELLPCCLSLAGGGRDIKCTWAHAPALGAPLHC